MPTPVSSATVGGKNRTDTNAPTLATVDVTDGAAAVALPVQRLRSNNTRLTTREEQTAATTLLPPFHLALAASLSLGAFPCLSLSLAGSADKLPVLYGTTAAE